MESDTTKRNSLFALAITTAVIRTLALTWLSTATIMKFRQVAVMCCYRSLALSLFTLSAVVYSLSWFVHSIGILWETVSDLLDTRYDWNATHVLCGLQTTSLAAVTAGLTAVAAAELLTKIFRRRWTVQVTKIVTFSIYAIVMSLAAFAVTRLSFPTYYGSLLESNDASSQNMTLHVDILLCGVDVGQGVIALLTPPALAAAAAVGIVSWTLVCARTTKYDVEISKISFISLGAAELEPVPCDCSARWSHLFRTAIAISCLTALWLLIWLLLNATLTNRSLMSGLALGKHLTIMAAAILAAITPADVSNDDELICVDALN